ncbi:hypothetical protein CDL12_04101 [Handroanthus impetiginosus]|uniref:RING-CH-type domain-containing protein n=1 Tax=Handroanthus impetiginosus TaxID=429701 RepID=A0A2G9I079_9LAMI|nr:hypothetical protein CDL12_04101 [Handroanthus impetiginosus]
MKAGSQEPLEKAEAADISILTSPKPSSALDEPEAPRTVNATQVPVKVTKSSRDTGSSHRKDGGKDTTERSTKGRDKGKDQVTVTDKKRKRSTPQAVESKYKLWSFHFSKRPRTSSGSLRVQKAIERGEVSYPEPRPFHCSGRLSGFVLRPSPIWEWELNKSELVMIKEKNSQQHSKGKEAELIIRKEEAICRFCFNIFVEDNVLKTKCTCKFTLIHEPCATEWSQKKGNNKCDVCEKDIQNMPVTLSEYQSSDTNKKDKSKRFFGCFGSQGS